MKSSSELFPVALLSAEYKDGIYEDVYSLKPNNSLDKTVEIALVRLHTERCRQSRPILLIHSAFHNHWQWLDYGFGGVAGRLVREGCDVWLMDWRGHGLSSRNHKPQLNTLKQMAAFDLPAVVDFIEECTGDHPALVARGAGCEMVSLAVAGGMAMPEGVFIDPTMLPPSRRYWMPGTKLLKRFGYINRRWLKTEGEEPEPRQLFIELLSKEGWLGNWVELTGNPVKPVLQSYLSSLRWAFTADTSPGWLHRLAVEPDRVYTATGLEFDWARLLPDTWASRTHRHDKASLSRDATRL